MFAGKYEVNRRLRDLRVAGRDIKMYHKEKRCGKSTVCSKMKSSGSMKGGEFVGYIPDPNIS